MSIGAEIKSRRIAQNLKQQELAERLNLERSTVTKWESGATVPKARSLGAVAKALNCTVSDLLGEDKGEEGGENEDVE